MDLQAFESDARTAHATGKYKLVRRKFGNKTSCCCLLMMVLLHRNRTHFMPVDNVTERLSVLYGGEVSRWLEVALGFDYQGPHQNPNPSRTFRLGRKLAREFFAARND